MKLEGQVFYDKLFQSFPYINVCQFSQRSSPA